MMAAIWYIGQASSRSIRPRDWENSGTQGTLKVWNAGNGFSIPQTEFDEAQIAVLRTDPAFIVDAPDGPREGVIPGGGLDSLEQTATRSWVASEFISRVAQAVQSLPLPEAIKGEDGKDGKDGLDSTVPGPQGPIGMTGATSQAQPRRHWPPTYLINALQGGHGWTAGGTLGSSNLDDTSDSVMGGQCLTMVTNGAGGQGYVQSPVMDPGVNLTGKGLVVWLKVEGASINNLAYIVVDACTSSVSNRARGYAMDPNGMLNLGEWVPVQIPWSNLIEANSFGGGITGSPVRSNINLLRITVADKGGVPVTVKIGAIGNYAEDTRYPNGVVSFSFDDSFAAAWTVAMPKLAQLGYRATLFPIASRLAATSGGWLTLAQAKMLQDVHGWEIGAHASTEAAHVNYPGLSAAAIVTEMEKLRAWQRENSFLSDSFAYPVGNYNQNAIEQIRPFYASARSNYNQVSTPATSQPHRLSGLVLGSSTTLAKAQTRMDSVAAGGGWQPIVVHNLIASGGGANDWTPANFNALVDYITSKGIAVVPIGDVLRR